jgi:hypothetical protein
MLHNSKHMFRPEFECLEGRNLPSLTPLQVAMAFTNSVEAQSDKVIAEYQQYLQRTPSLSEINGWQQQINAGMTYEVLDATFVGSVEYFNNHGGAGAAWVQSLYQNLLNRTPEPAEVNGWLGNLSQGASPQAVAAAFAGSTERLSDKVVMDYEHYLGRMPAPTEVEGWVAAMQAGLTDQEVAANMVASAEVLQIRDGGDLYQWVGDLYKSVLGRTGSQAEIQGWVNRICPPSTCGTGGTTGSDDGGFANTSTDNGTTYPYSDPTITPPDNSSYDTDSGDTCDNTAGDYSTDTGDTSSSDCGSYESGADSSDTGCVDTGDSGGIVDDSASF